MQAFIYALFVFCVWYADSSDLPLEELLNKDVSSIDSVLSSLDNDEVSLLGNSAVNSQGKFDLHGSWKNYFLCIVCGESVNETSILKTLRWNPSGKWVILIFSGRKPCTRII